LVSYDLMMNNHEVFENVVASVVDVASIMVAYTIGISQSSFLLGIAYAVFDAIIVVWLRKPLARTIQSLMSLSGRRTEMRDVYIADVS
jgi:hypothetical protein